MAGEFTEGDHVTCTSHGGEAEGEVEHQLTSDTEAAGRTVRASKVDPQHLVTSERTGREAVHKPSALHKDRAEEPARPRPHAPRRRPPPRTAD